MSELGERSASSCSAFQLRVAGGEHDLDQYLFAPFPELRLDHRVGARDAAVAARQCATRSVIARKSA